MLRAALVLAVMAALSLACGDDETVPASVVAQLPRSGQLYELCPVTDLPAADYDQRARRARDQARVLIREVRRRPDARVRMTFDDAHSGERFSETFTVEELARDHLRDPGIEGAPCARSVMAELEAATEGRSPPDPPPQDDRVYLIDDVVEALRLRRDGGIYRSRHCSEIQTILTTREEVEIALTEPIGNVEAVVDSAKGVGVEAFRPTPACRAEMAAALGRVPAHT